MVAVTFDTEEIREHVDRLRFMEWKADHGEAIFFYGGVQEIKNHWRQKYVKTCRAIIHDVMIPILMS